MAVLAFEPQRDIPSTRYRFRWSGGNAPLGLLAVFTDRRLEHTQAVQRVGGARWATLKSAGDSADRAGQRGKSFQPQQQYSHSARSHTRTHFYTCEPPRPRHRAILPPTDAAVPTSHHKGFHRGPVVYRLYTLTWGTGGTLATCTLPRRARGVVFETHRE